jgi:hypothetical protein
MFTILYLAKGRAEFTGASWHNLVKQTDWQHVTRIIVATDGDEVPSVIEWSISQCQHPQVALDTERRGGPVAIMNHHLPRIETPYVVKLDNDVIVPPGWLKTVLAALTNTDVDILGLEPAMSRTANPASPGRKVDRPEFPLARWTHFIERGGGYAPAPAVGGIFAARSQVFHRRDMPTPSGFMGVGGFTQWQMEHRELQIGWLVPPLQLFLLDRLPIEPWCSFSKRYIQQGTQRPWTNYEPHLAAWLWEWWLRG